MRNLFKFHLELFLISIFLLPSINSNSQNVWQTVNTLNQPVARMENSFVKVGEKFYLVGGLGGKPVHEYDPATNLWTLKAAAPLAIHHYQAVVHNNLIYAVCAFTGSFPSETPIPNIHVYNPATNTWSIWDSIPTNRRRGSAGVVVYNNEFYVACGIQNGHVSGWVPWMDKYNPATKTWTPLANAPQARDHYYATLAGDKIYLIGGRRTNDGGSLIGTTIAEVEVYDIPTNTWSILPSGSNVPTKRSGAPTILVGNEILLIGGETNTQSQAHNETEALNITTNTWRTLSDLVKGRHATTCFVHDSAVYIAAGSGSQGAGGELSSMERLRLRVCAGNAVEDCFGVCGGNAVVDNCGVCGGNNSCNCNLQVTGLVLVKAGTKNDIMPLANGAIINKLTVGSFSIRAQLCQSPVGSVKFFVNNTLTQTENGAPYAIKGDNSGTYVAWNPNVGTYTIQAIPYSGTNGSGTVGSSVTITITIINQINPPPDCNGVLGGSAVSDNCGVCSGGNTGHVANSDKDVCGVCFGNGTTCNDCNEVPGGSAVLDNCGICSGGNTGHVANSDKDVCGVCFGNGSTCLDCNEVPGGSAVLDNCGICSGGNTGHVANSDKDVCGVCFGNGICPCQPLEIISFTLMKAGTAGEIGALTNGMTINLATIGAFSIRANTCNGQNVGSVKFFVNNALIQTENNPPYAIKGDNPSGSYIAWTTTTGSKILTATPYSGKNGLGTVGVSETVSFTVINSAAKTDLAPDGTASSIKEGLLIYPNPNNGEFIMELNCCNSENLTLKVFNQLGQMVYETNYKMTSDYFKHDIDLPSRAPGIYLIQIESETSRVSKKVIVH